MNLNSVLSELTGKILLVDDSVENLKLLSALLADKYAVKVAKEGKTALRLLEEDEEIRLILLDIEMPNMSGIEVCKRVKENAKTKHIPVIFITGRDDHESEVEGLLAGGVDYIRKPFKPEIVMARVSSQWTIQAEKQRADGLLEILLPETVIKSLLVNGYHLPEDHDHASVLFFDLVGFTQASNKMEAKQLFKDLSTLFGIFDELTDKYGVQRIKTLGDGYLAVSGVDGNTSLHAARLAAMGLEMVDQVKNHSDKGGYPWQCRIGLNSGPMMSGIVGNTRFQFDVIGDTVNIASRVESEGKLMALTVTAEFLDTLGGISFESQSLGSSELKGKGERELFELVSLDASALGLSTVDE